MKSNLVNVVRTMFMDDVSAPNVRNLQPFGGKRFDNCFVVNDKVAVIAKEASELCTKDSYVFNFDPKSMAEYKKLAATMEVIIAMRCANDDRFCVLPLGNIIQMQKERELTQQLDDTKQLPVKIDITGKRSFSAYVNGGGKLNPVGTVTKSTGLITSWVRKLIRM